MSEFIVPPEYQRPAPAAPVAGKVVADGRVVRLRCSYSEQYEKAQLLVLQNTQRYQDPWQACAGFFPVIKTRGRERREELFSIPQGKAFLRPLVVELRRQDRQLEFRTFYISFKPMHDWRPLDVHRFRVRMPAKLMQAFRQFTSLQLDVPAGVIQVDDNQPLAALETALDGTLGS